MAGIRNTAPSTNCGITTTSIPVIPSGHTRPMEWFMTTKQKKMKLKLRHIQKTSTGGGTTTTLLTILTMMIHIGLGCRTHVTTHDSY